MMDTVTRNIEAEAERRAEKRRTQSVWTTLFQSFFALLVACLAGGVMVIQALNHELSAMLAAVLALLILLAGMFVSRTATAGFIQSLPELIDKIRGK